MKLEELEIGMTCYLPDGRQAEYLGKRGEDILVSPVMVFEDWGGEEAYERGQIEFAKTIYLSAPHEVYDEKIRVAEARVADMERQLDEMRSGTLEALAERKRLLDKLKEVPALKRIEDMLDGKITHVVMTEYGEYKIQKLSELEELDYGRRNGLPLLSVFGKSNGDMSYQINTYKDGSGSWRTLLVCTSEEEAVDQRREYILRAIETAMRGENIYALALEGQVARKFGIDIPPAARSAIASAIRSRAQNEINSLKKNAERELDRHKVYEAQLALADDIEAGTQPLDATAD